MISVLRSCLVLLFFCLAASPTLSAQADPIGEWRSYQSFSNGRYVTDSEAEIIYTTGRAIFYLDKQDLSIRTLTKVQGLTEARIDLIRYHRPTRTLIVVYANSAIDLIGDDGSISTLRQIENFSFSGDKRIYDIAFGDDDVAYLSAGFGLTSLDLTDELFPFTVFTGIRVNAAAEYAGQLYAATDEGLYGVGLSGVNVNDFGNWTLLGSERGLPGDYGSTAVTVYREQVYFGVNEDVYRLEGDTSALHFDAEAKEYRLQYLSAGPNTLLAGYRCQTENCFDRQLVALTDTRGVSRVRTDCIFRTNYAIEDLSGRIWLGDEAEGIRYLPNLDLDCDILSYPGPPTDRNYRLLHDGRELWVAPGVLNENFSPFFEFTGVYRLTEQEGWISYSSNDTPAFRGRDGERGGDDDVFTIVDVDYDPANDIHYFSSFYEGLVALDAEGEFTLFDERNSSLQNSSAAGSGRMRIAGTATDANGFTYVANSRADGGAIVSVRAPDGSWQALGTGCDENLALDIAVDRQGYVWVVHNGGSGGGLTVLDPAGTPLDPADDRCRTIRANNSALPTNAVRSIAVDLDGTVWIGTSEGIVTFGCSDSVFEAGQCEGERPVATADDEFNAFLLETEVIRAIAVDGANRKWVATSNGVYLLSPDGEEQLERFDSGNSPLLDDVVRDVAIDPNTGTVFFGTEGGVISYRAEATSAGRGFASELTIFPNPVEPDYEGPVAINGLSRDARVKITDLSGKLVIEANALGGQFVWDGNDYNGRRVTSGVYLVFAADDGGFDVTNANTAVGKIVFIR